MKKYFISYYTHPGWCYGIGPSSQIKDIILETRYSMETEKGIEGIKKQIRKKGWNYKGSVITILSWHRLKDK